jgi:hypothetical protein
MERITDRLTPKQQRALTALLTSRTHVEAAQKAEMSVTSLWRTMRNERFQAEYSRLRREAVDFALQRLQQGSDAAANTLLEILEDKTCPPSDRRGASKTVLEINIKFIELCDLGARIEAIEKTLAERGTQ